MQVGLPLQHKTQIIKLLAQHILLIPFDIETLCHTTHSHTHTNSYTNLNIKSHFISFQFHQIKIITYICNKITSLGFHGLSYSHTTNTLLYFSNSKLHSFLCPSHGQISLWKTLSKNHINIYIYIHYSLCDGCSTNIKFLSPKWVPYSPTPLVNIITLKLASIWGIEFLLNIAPQSVMCTPFQL